MLKRVITSVVALAVFAAVLIAPPIVFTIALALVTLFMLYEVYKATNADLAMKIVGFVSAIIFGLISMLLFAPKELLMGKLFFFAFAAVILLNMLLVIFEHGKADYKAVLANAFLTLYIVVSVSCIESTRESEGTLRMLLIFITAWSCDTFAYFSGRFFGKHKLIPHVSPNKTVEGAIGGVVGAIIACTVIFFIEWKMANSGASEFYALKRGLIIGGIGGICSQLGDLIASAIKRDTGIKDFGWIFPGHGGFMDRFDSVIFIAPIILFLVMVLGL